MPKIKKGLDYFDIDTDINNDMRVKLLRAEFGVKGFGIWIQLLIQIYGDEGYFMKWDKDTKLLFASDVGETGGLVGEVVQGSVKRGLFHKPVFDQFNVLTSKHIQQKYFRAIKRRESDMDVDARYLVIPVNDDIITDNDNIKLLNVNRTKQRREEKSKEEESRVSPANKPSFEKFWDLYDKKVDKKKSEKKWEKLSKSEKQAVMEFIPFYKEYQPDPTYRKNPTTFFNNRSWEDEFIPNEIQAGRTANDNQNGNTRQTKGDQRAKIQRDIDRSWPQ